VGTVKINEMDQEEQTDINGNFELSPIPSGTYTVTASAQGFEEQTIKPFEIVQGTTTVRDFALIPTS